MDRRKFLTGTAIFAVVMGTKSALAFNFLGKVK